MHGLDALRAQCGFEPQIKIRRVDTHEHIGAVHQQPVAQFLADGQDLAQVQQHLDIPPHRQFALRPPGLETLLDHAGPTDAEGMQFGPTLACTAQQQAGQQVA